MKRTGLALCDELGITTRALPVLVPKSRREDIEVILALCDEWNVNLVLIGLPTLPQSGDDTPWSKRVRGFAGALEQEIQGREKNIQVQLVDEHLSSVTAARRSPKSLDGESACILIEDYLNHCRPQYVEIL